MSAALSAFLQADFSLWRGFDPESMGPALTELGGPEPLILPGWLGDPPTRSNRISLPTSVFRGGLFSWHRHGEMVAVEGCLPSDGDGEYLTAPGLPEPDAAYRFPLGSVWLDEAERVYAERGLAVRVNPENGLLLGLVGFEPTTAEDYAQRLRPNHQPTRFLASSGVGR